MLFSIKVKLEFFAAVLSQEDTAGVKSAFVRSQLDRHCPPNSRSQRLTQSVKAEIQHKICCEGCADTRDKLILVPLEGGVPGAVQHGKRMLDVKNPFDAGCKPPLGAHPIDDDNQHLPSFDAGPLCKAATQHLLSEALACR